jgi:hypothetical protein
LAAREAWTSHVAAAEHVAAVETPAESSAPECDFAGLPEDALSYIFTLLPAYSLRAAAASNTAWCRALRSAPNVAVLTRPVCDPPLNAAVLTPCAILR